MSTALSGYQRTRLFVACVASLERKNAYFDGLGARRRGRCLGRWLLLSL